jgi:hypothetical protein
MHRLYVHLRKGVLSCCMEGIDPKLNADTTDGISQNDAGPRRD